MKQKYIIIYYYLFIHSNERAICTRMTYGDLMQNLWKYNLGYSRMSKSDHTPRTVLRGAGRLAGFRKLVNTLLLVILPTPAPALSAWTPMYHHVHQTLPASFSQNCSQCVGTKRLLYSFVMSTVTKLDGRVQIRMGEEFEWTSSCVLEREDDICFLSSIWESNNMKRSVHWAQVKLGRAVWRLDKRRCRRCSICMISKLVLDASWKPQCFI